MSAKDVVVSATERLFNRKDTSVIDESFGPVYVQHSALGADGVEGLRGLVTGLPDSTGYDLVRVLADGELVVTEGLFHGFAPIPLTGYDVWRVVDGRVVEHWDALGPAATHPSSSVDAADAPATDAPATDAPATDAPATAANKALVTEWAETVLVGGDHDAAGDYLSPTHDVAYDTALVYSHVHTVIADGDLVYTRSEGESNGPVIVNDVWRVAGGRIVDHWGLVAPVPPAFPHGNGAF